MPSIRIADGWNCVDIYVCETSGNLAFQATGHTLRDAAMAVASHVLSNYPAEALPRVVAAAEVTARRYAKDAVTAHEAERYAYVAGQLATLITDRQNEVVS